MKFRKCGLDFIKPFIELCYRWCKTRFEHRSNNKNNNISSNKEQTRFNWSNFEPNISFSVEKRDAIYFFRIDLAVFFAKIKTEETQAINEFGITDTYRIHRLCDVPFTAI